MASLTEHLEKLRYFVEIAESGSLATASRKLHISQPSLTHTIKMLESVIGSSLLIRTSKGVKLTPAGEKLYRFGCKLRLDTEKLENELRLQEETQTQEVRLGIKEPYAAFLWPNYLKRLEVEFPKIEVTFNIDRTNSGLLSNLRKGDLDILMIPDPPNSEDFYCVEVFKDNFAIYSAPGLEQNQAPIYIFKKGLVGRGETLESIIKRRRISEMLYRDVDSYNVAKAMALKRLGHAILPLSMVFEELKSGSLVKSNKSLFPFQGLGELKACFVLLSENSRNSRLRSLIRAIKKIHSAPSATGRSVQDDSLR